MPEYQDPCSISSRRRRANEMHDAALQFVRKISGYTHPSKANEAAFHEAVEDIEKVVKRC